MDIATIIDKINTPHAKLTYVGNHYSKADLITDLEGIKNAIITELVKLNVELEKASKKEVCSSIRMDCLSEKRGLLQAMAIIRKHLGD